MHTAYGDTSCIVGVVQARYQHLGCTLELNGSRYVLHDTVKQVEDIVGRLLPVLAHPSVLGRTVDDREIKLLFCGIEVAHEVEHHLVHLLGTAVGLIHLVHYHDGLKAYLQCLLQHESCLGHGSLECINQQYAGVRHIEHALHLASEVAVTRCVDDVYLGAFVIDGDILAQDSDAALPLQLVVVQHQIVCLLVLTEQVSRKQHLVHQSGLAMVNVCNDGNVSDILHILSLLKLVRKVTTIYPRAIASALVIWEIRP